jgi:hypothetical protein
VVAMTIKIFIGLTEIAGYYGNLKRGFQEIGIECTFIDLSSHPFEYNRDDEPNILVQICKWNLRQMKKVNYKILKAPFFVSNKILMIPIFIWTLYHFNVFIFAFGHSFFRNHDLPLLKFFNKKVLFIFNGSDERPPYIDGSRHNLTPDDYKKISREIKSNIVAIEKYADCVLTNPASAHYHIKKCGNICSIGLPFESSVKCINHQIGDHDHVQILHSPSDPIGKGSDHIRNSINILKKKGYNINYIEITGKPHHQVIEELQKCDFIIDQVYSDQPMATFATEAAWFGKPAVVGGYYTDHIHNDFTQKHIPPSLFCHPDEITTAIEHLIVDEEFRLDLGKKAQEFIRTQRTPEMVARRYLQIIEGSILEEHMFDPNNIQYVQGSGMPESQSKEIIRNMIEHYGIESLCLSDKPKLEQRFMEYAYDIRE